MGVKGLIEFTATPQFKKFSVNPLILESGYHLISHCNITHQVIEAFDCQTNSPCQHLKKCIKNSMENMHTDVIVKKVKVGSRELVSLPNVTFFLRVHFASKITFEGCSKIFWIRQWTQDPERTKSKFNVCFLTLLLP